MKNIFRKIHKIFPRCKHVPGKLIQSLVSLPLGCNCTEQYRSFSIYSNIFVLDDDNVLPFVPALTADIVLHSGRENIGKYLTEVSNVR